MHFIPEFNPAKIEEWGPDVEDQSISTPEKKTAPDNGNILTPEFQKLIVDMTRGNVPTNANSTHKPQNLPISSVPSSSQQSFNVQQLPADVRLIYNKRSSNQLITGNEMKPFITSIPENQNPNKMRTCHYHLDPPGIGHRLITRDGTVFHL